MLRFAPRRRERATRARPAGFRSARLLCNPFVTTLLFRRFPTALLVACALYVAYRLLVLFTNFDEVCLPQYELSWIGNLAKELSEGWDGAPLYLYYDNCGGHLLTGIFGALSYTLFGDSYLALKLVNLVLGVALAVVMWSFASRHFSRRSAVLFVFLFVLGPVTLAKYSMLAKGNHFENLIFQVLALVSFYRLHTSAQRAPHWLFFTGFVAGFGVFAYFGILALLCALAAMHLAIRGPRGFLHDLVLTLPGFFLGLIPLAWIELNTGARGTSTLFNGLRGRRGFSLERTIDRTVEFYGEILPRAPQFEDLGPVPGSVANGVFLAAFAAAWVALALELVRALARLRRTDGATPDERERARFESLKVAPFVLYLPLITIIIATGRANWEPYAHPVEVGTYRILVPHFFLSLFTIAVAADRLMAGSRARRGAGIALYSAATLSGLFALSIVTWDFRNADAPLKYAGHSFRSFGTVLSKNIVWKNGKGTWDHAAIAEQASGFPGTAGCDVHVGAGFSLAWTETLEGKRMPKLEAYSPTGPSLAALCAPYDAAHYIDLIHGLGAFLRGHHLAHPQGRERLAALLAEKARVGDPLAGYLVEGLCLDLSFPLLRRSSSDLRANRRRHDAVPDEWKPAWQRGSGRLFGELARRGLAHDRIVLQRELPKRAPDLERDFWFGFGWGLVTGGEPLALPDEFVPAESHEDVLFGAGSALRHAHGEAGARRVLALAKGLSDRSRATLEAALDWPDYPAYRDLQAR